MISVVLCLRVQLLGLLLFGSSFFILCAQPHNGEVYQQLLQTYLSEHPGPYSQVEGQQIDNFVPSIQLDSSSSARLTIGFAEILYRPTDKNQLLRRLELSIQVEDSVLRSETLSFQDTLTPKAIHQIYHQSPKPLRGENPTRRAKWGMPMAMIVGSIGGMITLFYFRSR
ncbi:MAG: hypothetical protein AAF587_04425 [Bacteroidota bacterium]